MTSKYELPPIPRGESPIPISEVPKEDAGGLNSHWLDRRARRGDGPPYFRPPGSKRRMTYPSWVRMWALGLLPSGPPSVTQSSMKRSQRKQRERVRELEPA